MDYAAEGQSLALQQKYKEAIPLLKKAETQLPDDPDVANWLFISYKNTEPNLGPKSNAYKYAKKSVTLNPGIRSQAAQKFIDQVDSGEVLETHNSFGEPVFGKMKWTKTSHHAYCLHMQMAKLGMGGEKTSEKDIEKLVYIGFDTMEYAKAHPEDPDVPGLLFDTAVVKEENYDPETAQTFYYYIIENFPKTEYAAKAKAKLN